MNRIVFPEKRLGETVKVTFDFTSRLALGESVSSASTVATVYSGTDAAPSGLISGSATIASPRVTQALTGGVLGVVYLVTCTAVTSASQTLILSGYIAVR